MLFGDTYQTIERSGTGELKDRGSKFIGFSFHAEHEDDVKKLVAQVKKDHPQAAHHCHAFVTGADKEMQKFNDDREPANTAGRPILRAILARDLTNTAVVVVRYFGGKLLGVPGLIAAYEGAAIAALENSVIRKEIVTERYELSFDYENENEAFRVLKQFGLKVLQHHHGDEIRLIFEVRKSQADIVLEAIRQKHTLKIKVANL